MFDLLLRAPRKHAKDLSRAELETLFAAAWNLSGPKKRPQTGGSVLAVDLHWIGDRKIAELNERHMNHEGPTDVLSFPLLDHDPARGAFHLGEILVSVDTAKREAFERGLPYREELARYCVHGFLHLLGWDDATAAQRKALFAVQERALKTVAFAEGPRL